MIEVTEQIIAKAGLTKDEAKVARFFHNLPSAGGRTKHWVSALSSRKRLRLLESAERKIREMQRLKT